MNLPTVSLPDPMCPTMPIIIQVSSVNTNYVHYDKCKKILASQL